MSYLFKSEDVFSLANFVNAETKQKAAELQFKHCPLCKGGQHNDRWTFSVNVVTGKFKCQRSSCGKQGGFITLAKEVGFPLDFGTKEPLTKTYKRLPQISPQNIIIRDGAVEYLNNRGIPETITRKYGITTQKDNQNIICMPFYDWNGELTMIKYRNIKFKKGDNGSKEWVSKDTKPILYGIQNVNYDNDTLVITEGQIDSLSLTAAGIENAVSVPMGKNNFNWINTCWDFLQHFSKIIVFGDNENGQITLVNEIAQKLKRHQILVVRPSDYQGMKDANDILRNVGVSELVQAVNNAKPLQVDRITSLADIKSVDISEMPHFSTGIAEIDKLTGGFFEGQLIILSGKRGEGKSTLASQIVIEAVDQHIPTLVYSGELPNYQFKNWINLQSAGIDNLIPHISNGREYFTIKNDEIKESINEWYRDLLYIVDDGELPDGETELDLIETAIYRHKIKFCLVDNLMCLAEYGESIYQNQGKVVKRLKEIATAAKCTILLIAHERKMQSSDLSDNVSGSSDITNRADVVLRYARSADDNGGHIEVAKNRLFGTLARVSNKNQIVTSFDPASRRISTEKSWNMYKVYGWANQSRTTEKLQPIGEDGDLPF